MALLKLVLAKGTDKDFLLQATTDGSSGITTFLSGDTLAARVWPGGSHATVATPAVAWADATVAKFTLSLVPADTSSLDVGSYRVQVTLTRSGRTIVVADCSLALTEAPAATPLEAIYTSYADMLIYAPWLETLQSDRDCEGFRAQRGLARQWLDNLILSKYRGYGGGTLSYPLVNTFGGGSYGGGKDKWLKDQLTADLLMRTPEITEAVSKYAIALVLQAQLPNQNDKTWPLVASRFLAEARSKVSCIVAELDLDGDGYGDIQVHLGSSNTLFG